MKYAIGIDIGGTKIALALGTERGKILRQEEIPTKTGAQSRRFAHFLAAYVKNFIRESGIPTSKISGIGVGCPGAVNPQNGLIPRSPNLPGWKGIPLRNILSGATGLPVFFANDANAAAIAESVFGAGKGVENFIYITVSTGIGGGIVLNGRIYEGSGFVAGEIGHLSVVPDGNQCNCGRRGCLEAYASGTAIGRFVQEHRSDIKSSLKSTVFRDGNFGARQVGLAAKAGDRTAIESYRRAGYYLGIGIADLLNILNPEKIIIGGGVLRSAHEIFWKTMLISTKRHAWPEAFRTVEIVKSPLMGYGGALGALALVFGNRSCVHAKGRLLKGE